MAGKITAVIVSENKSLIENVREETRSLVEIKGVFDDPLEAYGTIKQNVEGLVFIDIAEKSKEGLFLAKRINRLSPKILTFLLAKEKNADLLLESLRVGVADYIIYPVPSGEILKSLENCIQTREGTNRRGKIYAFFSTKGSQGTTTMAVNMADHIHSLSGERVVAVDLNLDMGDVSVFLDLPSTYTTFDLARDIKRMDENLLLSSLTRHERGFYVLSAPEEISDPEEIKGEEITNILSLLARFMDYIIIDLPHEFSERTFAAISSSDRLFVIIQQSMPVIKSVQKGLQLLQELGFGEEKISVVLNRYVEKSELTPDDILRILKQPEFALVANDYLTATDAINRGKPLGAVRESSMMNGDIAKFAGKLTGIKPKQEKRGWWGSLGLNRFIPTAFRI